MQFTGSILSSDCVYACTCTDCDVEKQDPCSLFTCGR